MNAMKKDPFENICDLPVVNRGAWLATASGNGWSIEHPSVRDVQFMDIALGLSRTCRYGGQIREDFVHYAVSEHSDLMTDWAIENGVAKTLEEALSVKLHDAAEYVFGDIQTPLKRMLPDYDKMEKAAQDIIMESFGLHKNKHALDKKTIKMIDQRIFLDECAKLLVDPGRYANLQAFNDVNPTIEPLFVKIECLDQRAALESFTSDFVTLCENMPAADAAWRESIQPHVEDAKNLLSRISLNYEADGPTLTY